MVNNELSGPVVLTQLARTIFKRYPNPYYTYRFVLHPETIGSIAYLSRYKQHLKDHVFLGINLSCVGDDRAYSVVQTPWENTFADKVFRAAFLGVPNPHFYGYQDRGSDERNYCWPGVDLPMVCFSRSKFHQYPEYHTSADDLTITSEKTLLQSHDLLANIIHILELGRFLTPTSMGEPFLSRLNLYPELSQPNRGSLTSNILNILSHSSLDHDLFDICISRRIPLPDAITAVETILSHNRCCTS